MRRTSSTVAIREHWNRRAPTFDAEDAHGIDTPEQREAWCRLLSRVAGAPPKKVLDVGCGTGILTFLLSELGHRVTGVDFSPTMIELARKKTARAHEHVTFRCEAADSLADADGTYDLVIARHVIWNLPAPHEALAEWLRVLRPGGSVALIEGAWASKAELLRAYRRSLPIFAVRFVRAAVLEPFKRKGRLRRSIAARRYRRVEATLPLAGGAQSGQLRKLLESAGFSDPLVEPLEGRELWGDENGFPRYLALAKRPCE